MILKVNITLWKVNSSSLSLSLSFFLLVAVGGGGVEMCAEEKDLKKPRNPGSQGLGLGRGESMEH